MKKFFTITLSMFCVLTNVVSATAAIPPNIADTTAGPRALIADTGFRPGANGFKFENYTNSLNPVNLTPASMQRLFGNVVCATLENGVCLLTPPAQQWMQQQNNSMNGGHCEGMAVLASFIYTNTVTPAPLGAATVPEFELQNNAALQSEIAYWFATQATLPSSATEDRNQNPADVLTKLIDEFKKPNGQREEFVLGLYKPEYKDGHAVSPYAIDDRGDNIFWIMVYDNNFPNQERYVEVNRAANSWRYTTAINPSAAQSEYIGGADTKTLTLIPLSVRIQPQICPFCEAANPFRGDLNYREKFGAGAAVSRDEVIVNGDDVNVLITDANNRRLGYTTVGQKVKLVKEIPDADFATVRTNFNDSQPPIYYVPNSNVYTVTLDGANLTKTAETNVSVFGAGYVLGVESIILDPGQKDQIVIDSKDAQRSYTVTYSTAYNESPFLVMGIETDDASYEVDVIAYGDANGLSLTLNLNHNTGKVSVRTNLTSGDEHYDLRVTRIDATGEHVFNSNNISLAAASTHYIDYAAWTNPSRPLTIGVDNGNNGSIDRTLTLSAASKIYMPLLLNQKSPQ